MNIVCPQDGAVVPISTIENAVPTGRLRPPVNGIQVSEFGPVWVVRCHGTMVWEPCTTSIEVFAPVAIRRLAE